MPEPIVFLHVPKAGGNSLTNMLCREFRVDELYPSHRVRTLGMISDEDSRKYRLFVGHFDYSEVARLPGTPQIVTMLREPISRLLSLFRFWNSYSPEQAERDKLHGPLFAHKAGIDGFFAADAPPGIHANYNNSMVRQIVGRDYYTKGEWDFYLPDDEIVELAKSRIDSFAACGITEEFERSAQLIFDALGLGDQEVRYDNKTMPRPEDEDLTVEYLVGTNPALLERLNYLTRLDQQVYDHACRRLAELPAARQAVASFA